jgi:hypothetical protein
MPDRPADRDPDDESASSDGELDFDAEFSRLVADWGPMPSFEEPAPEAPARPRDDDSLKRLLRQAWPDEEPTPAREVDAEEHFEPPPPPPLPRPEPRRLVAWIALFGAPILGLVLLVSPLPLPSYVGYLLFASFVGGFGYLVATMGGGRGHDGWDDGARL